MGQHLLVDRHGCPIEAPHAERRRDLGNALALRQLPQSAEQAVGSAPRQHDRATALEP
jgi:hypothetical protein